MAILPTHNVNAQTGFYSLSDDIVSQILLMLPVKDFATVQKVCSLLRNNARQDESLYLQRNCPKAFEHLNLTLEGLYRINNAFDKIIKKHESRYVLPEGVMISDSEDSETEGTVLNFSSNDNVSASNLVSPALRKLSQNITGQMNQYCGNRFSQLKKELSLLVALCVEHTQKNEFLVDESILIERLTHLETVLSFCSLFYDQLNETELTPHFSDLIHEHPITRLGIYIKLLLVREMGINIHNEEQFKNCCNDPNQIPYLSPNNKKDALQMWDKETNQIYLSASNPLAPIGRIYDQLLEIQDGISLHDLFGNFPQELQTAILELSPSLQSALDENIYPLISQEIRRIFAAPSENLIHHLSKIQELVVNSIPCNFLHYFPNLETIIALDNRRVSSTTFARCNNLKTISLYLSPVKNIEPRAFFDCKNLKKLNLGGTQLQNFDPEILVGCTALEELNISNSNLTGLPPFSFIHAPNLKGIRCTKFVRPLEIHTGAMFGLKGCKVMTRSDHNSPTSEILYLDGANERWSTPLFPLLPELAENIEPLEKLNELLIHIKSSFGMQPIYCLCSRLNPVFNTSSSQVEIDQLLYSNVEQTLKQIYGLDFILQDIPIEKNFQEELTFLRSMFGMDPIYRICEELSPDFKRDCSQDEIDEVLYADLDQLKEATITVIREIVEFLAQETTFQEGLEEY